MKAAVWLRVSTGDQDEANQLPEILAYCKTKGYEVVQPFYEVHGKSASKGKHQKDLDRALADMALRRFEVLVVWASDRIERRGAESVFDLARKVREAGGRIEYVKDSYLNEANEMSDVMLALAATRDHQESKRKSDRAKSMLATIRSNGALGGKAPWGYRSEGTEKYKKKLVPTALGRQWVPVIFEMVAEGRSLSEVRQFLTKSEVRTGTKKKDGTPGSWWQTLVGDMIRNTTYFGQQQDAGGNVIHRCEALVSLALWERSNKALTAANRNTTTRGPGSLPRAMLTGAVWCGHCDDSPMYRIRSGNKGYRYDYYRCAGRGADRQSCGNMIRCTVVDDAVNDIAARTFFKPVMRIEVVEGHDYDAELSDVLDQLRLLPTRMLSDEDEDAERARLRDEKKRLTGLQNVPESVREVPTGETYSGLWNALEPAQRGPWLRSQGFRVSATKDIVNLTQPGHPKAVGATFMLRENEIETEVAA